MVGHHPAFSGDQSYFRDDDTGKPESSAWGTVSYFLMLIYCASSLTPLCAASIRHVHQLTSCHLESCREVEFAASTVLRSSPLQFAALVKKYQPHFYVNGHDHVMCYFNAAMYGFSTQFFTSGALGNIEPSVTA